MSLIPIVTCVLLMITNYSLEFVVAAFLKQIVMEMVRLTVSITVRQILTKLKRGSVVVEW